MMSTKISHSDLKDEIYKIIIERHHKSGGHNGVYGVELKNKTNVDWQIVRGVLGELYKENKIQVREGSKGKLFFPKIKNNKLKTIQK